MSAGNTPRVMFVGHSPAAASYLLYRLQAHGCECHFGRSYDSVRWLLGARAIDLVLGTPLNEEKDAGGIVAAFENAGATLFCFHVHDERCWWVPVVRQGRRSPGGSALRPSEFVGALDQIVAEIKADLRAPLAMPA